MAQMHRQPDSPRTPATPSTVEQLLRGETSKWTSPKSPLSSASMFIRDHELENDHGHHPKKSVLMKMKDKAKKLRNSFSKRRHGEDMGNISMSSGANLEDEDGEEDAEYNGAPMHESESAPDEYHKDNGRNHQNPKLFSDKNVLTSIKSKATTSPREKHHSPNKDKAVAVAPYVSYNPSSPNKPLSPNKGAASVKPPSPRQLINQTNMSNKFPSPRKPTTQSACTSCSSKPTTQSACTSCSSNPTNQSACTSCPSNPSTQSACTSCPSNPSTQSACTSCPSKAGTEEEYSCKGVDCPFKATTGGTAGSVNNKQAQAYPAVSDATHAITSKIQGVAITKPVTKETTASAPATPQNSSASSTPDSHPLSAPAGTSKEAGHSKDHQWDKGVSVKEYIMNKFEPGEDERALSRVISDVMSPRKTPGDAGVVDKVREAVSSLLRNDDSPKKSMDTQSANYHSSPQIPVSTNPQEVSDQEDNQGRILQAN